METNNPTSGPKCTNKKDIFEIMASCRVCMARSAIMKCIFETDKENITERIMFCTGVQLSKDDGLPTNICDQCLYDLSIAYKFKTTCLLADETFRNILKADIKTEAPESDYDVISYDFDQISNNIADADVKEELVENFKGEVRKSIRVKMKKENCESTPELKVKRQKRGPYKTGKPRALRKFKFRKLYCEPCGVKFTTKQQSDEHKKTIHKESDTYVCEICGKTFIHRASHYTHIKSHLPPQYGCEQCDYRTSHKHDLVKHIRIHTGVKHYQCEFCTSSFYTATNLTGHIRRLHEGKKRFHCTMCDRKFYDRTKLNRHVDSHNDIKRFECEVCHSFFTRRCYWKKHLHRQHNIVVPPQRPGRQKTNLIIGDALVAGIPSQGTSTAAHGPPSKTGFCP